MVAAPYNCGGKAADGSTSSRPLQSIREAVSVHRTILSCQPCGHLHLPAKLALTDLIPLRFGVHIVPGGSGYLCIGTIPVRNCLAALPPYEVK